MEAAIRSAHRAGDGLALERLVRRLAGQVEAVRALERQREFAFKIVPEAAPADVATAAKREILEGCGVTLRRGFEENLRVAGGVLEDFDDLGGRAEDAAVLLRFDGDTDDLPLHVHDFSERALIVLEGSGSFHVANARKLPRSVTAHPVTAGDLVAFGRGVLHTFTASSDGLMLLSYHAPHISLDDPRQYRIPADVARVRWLA